MQLCKKILQVVTLLVFGGMVSCATTKIEISPVVASKPYKETFNVAKSYMQRCFPSANLRTNLYTDIPEGEILLDRLPAATFFFVGGIGTSSFESAQEVVNLRFVGEGGSTKVFAQSEFSRTVLANALENKPCPKQK